MAFNNNDDNGINNMGFQKKDSGCWDASTDIGSCTEDEGQVTIHPAAPAPVVILANDFLIEPYEMDVDGKENEAYVKSGSNKDCSIFMTPESGKPHDEKDYYKKNGINNSIIGGNLGATGDKGSCKSVTSIMIAPSLSCAESRSSLISGGKGGGHGDLPGLAPEPWHNILRDITIPFFVAGLGMVGAGLLLDIVQVSVFNQISLKMSF